MRRGAQGGLEAHWNRESGKFQAALKEDDRAIESSQR
jgi:hypothetical protein